MITLALVTLALLIISRSSYAQSTVSFDSLTPGNILTDQLVSQGVRFVPFNGLVTATIVATSAGNVANFNHCEQGGSTTSCEFFVSGARGVFIDQHKFVKVHVGLFSHVPTPFQTQLTLTGHNANGDEVASATINVVADTGFATEIIATSSDANIASFTLSSPNDLTHNADIGILDLEFDPPGPVRVPDFVFEGPGAITVVAGGPSVDVPLSMFRLGGSTGGIAFSATNLPANVVATFLPPHALESTVTMRLTASQNLSNSTTQATITGRPTTTTAGASPRFFKVYVNIAAGFSLYGPSMVDLSVCRPGDGTHGSVVIPYTVLRDPSISGPSTLTIPNLPPDLSFSFSPAELTFAGWALGATTNLTLTSTAGIEVPDTVLQIELTNGSIHETFELLVHGTCPRQNRNSIIRGVFSCNNQGLVTPLANAEVEFFRYRSGLSDQLLGSTITNADGSYETNLWTSNESDFYARLRLEDPGRVYLVEALNSTVWTKDTEHKRNRDPVIDFGELTVSRDQGKGTPMCAIWQGAQRAYREFEGSVGESPPIGNYQILMWKTIRVPYSYLSTTNWPDNHRTSGVIKRTPKGIDPFLDYETSFHEFGHTIRHTSDGDRDHFLNDAVKYGYASEHNYCRLTNEGFAFNEGWAQYWSGEPQHRAIRQAETGTQYVCRRDIISLNPATDPFFKIEGLVAEDLEFLASCTGVTRKDMFNVLRAGQNIIHGDKEFRQQFKLHFPEKDFVKCSPINESIIPTSTNTTTASVVSGLEPIDTATLVAALRADLDSQVQVTSQLRKDLEDSLKVAADPGICPAVSCELVAERVVGPERLRGAIKLSEQVQRGMESDLARLQSGKLPEEFPKDFEELNVANKNILEGERKEIVKSALDHAITALTPYVTRDNTGALAKQSAQLARELRLLGMRTPANNAYLTFLKLPRSVRDDGLVATAVSSQWSVKRIVLVVVCILLAALLVSVLVWLVRRRLA